MQNAYGGFMKKQITSVSPNKTVQSIFNPKALGKPRITISMKNVKNL